MCTLEHSAKQRHTTWRKPACMRCPSPASFEPRDTLCILVSRVSRCIMSILDASPACAASDPALWVQRLWVSEVGWGQTAYLAGSSLPRWKHLGKNHVRSMNGCRGGSACQVR
jgi:hypothetical protein